MLTRPRLTYGLSAFPFPGHYTTRRRPRQAWRAGHTSGLPGNYMAEKVRKKKEGYGKCMA